MCINLFRPQVIKTGHAQ